MLIELIYYSISALIALFLALLLYKYKTNWSKLNVFLIFLRSITVFGLLLLLVNPKHSVNTITKIKPKLYILLDNSESITHLNKNKVVAGIKEKIVNNSEISKKFDLVTYHFGSQITTEDSLNFTGTHTNITSAIERIHQIERENHNAILLVSDGNHNYGPDLLTFDKNLPGILNTVAVGDTIKYADLSITTINANSYVYKGNKTTIEAIINYEGEKELISNFKIFHKNKLKYQKELRFDSYENTHFLDITLDAEPTGKTNYTATIEPFIREKNTTNNNKEFIIETVERQSKIALIYEKTHPDIGMFKKAIEKDKFIGLELLSPEDFVSATTDFDVAVVYQPNKNFKKVFEIIENDKINHFVSIGHETDYKFINNSQQYFKYDKKLTVSAQGKLNPRFNWFDIDSLNFRQLPPIQTTLGSCTFSTPHQVLLQKVINNIPTDKPLLTAYETTYGRGVLFEGEGLWKWRMQSFIPENKINPFDLILGKIITFLRMKERDDPIKVDYELIYNNGEAPLIKAYYYDSNLETNTGNTLQFVLTNSDGVSTSYSMLPKNNHYEIPLKQLKPGEYKFTVSSLSNKDNKSGAFKISKYNIEQSAFSANTTVLANIAKKFDGKLFYENESDRLIEYLNNDKRYYTLQKQSKKFLPLIEIKLLLFVLLLSLALEWVLRKFNGLS